MPISATGKPGRRAEAGFTLIELMVVIAIIGVAAAAVVFTAFPAGPSPRAQAEQLAARLVAARTMAITANTDTALVLSEAGYSFEQRGPSGWQPMRIPDHVWQKGLLVAAQIEGGGRLRFDSTGLATPATIALGPVRVVVSSAGEIGVE